MLRPEPDTPDDVGQVQGRPRIGVWTSPAAAHQLAAPPDVARLTQRVSRGALWTLLSFATARLLAFATNVVLAHLLSPVDFGIVSFAMIAIGAFTLLQDLGVTQAVIFSKRHPDDIAATSLSINLLAATVLFLASLAIAPAMAAFGHQPQVGPILAVLACGLVLTSLGSTQAALLKKNLSFQRNVVPDIVSSLISSLVAITLALHGFGPWSLVYGYLVRAATASALLWWLSPIRPRPRLDRRVAADLIHYGKHVSLSSIVGFAFMNVDYLIVGHALGTASLGIYTLAYTIATVHFSAINQVVTTVAFPAYSKLRDNRPALLRMAGDVLRIVAMVSIAAGIAIFACAPAFVSMALNSDWSDVLIPLQVLTIFGVLASIDCVFPPIYRAIGHPEYMWKINLLRLAALVPVMLLFVRFGIVGVAAAHVVTLLCLAALSGTALARILDTPAATFWRPVMGPFTAGLAGAAVVAVSAIVPTVHQLVITPFGAAGLTSTALATFVAAAMVLDRRLLTLVVIAGSGTYGRVFGRPDRSTTRPAGWSDEVVRERWEGATDRRG